MRVPIKISWSEEGLKERINLLLEDKYVSFTAIQNFFDVGYPTAGRIIDEMFSLDLIVEINGNSICKRKYNMQKSKELESYLYNKFLKLNTTKN